MFTMRGSTSQTSRNMQKGKIKSKEKKNLHDLLSVYSIVVPLSLLITLPLTAAAHRHKCCTAIHYYITLYTITLEHYV